MEKINCILTRRKCSKWLDTLDMLVFWMCQFQWHRFWGCTFRCFLIICYMYALSWKLLIIWTTFGIFYNITQITTPEENSWKMFHISSPIVLFSYGKVKVFLGGKGSNFIWGGQKEGVRGDIGRSTKWGLFLQNSHYYARYQLYLTNCWSDNFSSPP